MNKKVLLTLAASFAASVTLLGAGAEEAGATTFHAANGSPFSGPDATNYTTNTGGVRRTAAGSGFWMLPLEFVNGGGRNVVVKGRVLAGGSMSCTGVVLDNAGTIVANSGAVAFPVTGVYTSINVNIAAVPFGGTGVIFCQLTGANLQDLLGTDYVL